MIGRKNYTMRKNNQAALRIVGVGAGLGFALLSLPGCFSVPIPQAEADPARFYVLSTTPPTAAPGASVTAAGEEASAPAVHLQAVDVASYLRSRPMIVRRGTNEIQFREFARWGESLDLGIARVLREQLLARGAASDVLVGGIRAPGTVYDYTLSVRVLACEGGADGSVLFHAVWELASLAAKAPRAADAAGAANAVANVPTVIRRGYRPMDLRWDGTTEASLAAQLSAAVAGLAGEIAGALKK